MSRYPMYPIDDGRPDAHGHIWQWNGSSTLWGNGQHSEHCTRCGARRRYDYPDAFWRVIRARRACGEPEDWHDIFVATRQASGYSDCLVRRGELIDTRWRVACGTLPLPEIYDPPRLPPIPGIPVLDTQMNSVLIAAEQLKVFPYLVSERSAP